MATGLFPSPAKQYRTVPHHTVPYRTVPHERNHTREWGAAAETPAYLIRSSIFLCILSDRFSYQSCLIESCQSVLGI